MTPEETYLIANLTSVASGQTRGRFSMGGHFARVFLRLIEADPLYVEFSATDDFKKSYESFKRWKGMIPFTATTYGLLERSSRDLCGLDVGRKAALGLFCLFNEDIRRHAEGWIEDTETPGEYDECEDT